MDTGSSAAAASLCGRCRGLSRKIDVELGIVLQVGRAHFPSLFSAACSKLAGYLPTTVVFST